MLSKLLITLLVVVIAVMYLRYRRRGNRSASTSAHPAKNSTGNVHAFLGQADQVTQSQARRKYRLTLLFWISMTAILVGALALTLWNWQKQQQELTILLHDSSAPSPVVYRVKRKDLHDDFFITTDGVRVVISQSERMEIIGL